MTASDTDVSNEPNADADPSPDEPKLDLDVKVAKPSACERHITVTVAADDVKRYYDKAFTELMPKASVPGFRSGRAPRKLVESHFRSDVTDQIKGSLLLDSMTQVTDSEEFAAISEPDFDFEAVEIPEEGPLTFEFDLEVRPEFDLPQWKGMTIEKPVREFSRDDVDAHLEKVLARFAKSESHDGPVQSGDFLVVDLKVRRNGKILSQARDLTVSVRPTLSFRDGNLNGFDELMVGAKVGQQRSAKMTLTADAANADLRGEEVELEIEVTDIRRSTLPELDEEMLARIGGFSNEGELRDAVIQELERQLVYHQQKRIRQQITEALTESADWELPPGLLERQAHRELERAVMELRSSGFSEEEIRAHQNELRQNNKKATARALKEHFILERIAEAESLEASESDFQDELIQIAYQSNESVRSVKSRFEKRGLMDALQNQIIERKAIDSVRDNAKTKEVPFVPEQETVSAIDHAAGGGSEAEIPDAKHGGDQQALTQPQNRS